MLVAGLLEPLSLWVDQTILITGGNQLTPASIYHGRQSIDARVNFLMR